MWIMNRSHRCGISKQVVGHTGAIIEELSRSIPVIFSVLFLLWLSHDYSPLPLKGLTNSQHLNQTLLS